MGKGRLRLTVVARLVAFILASGAVSLAFGCGSDAPPSSATATSSVAPVQTSSPAETDFAETVSAVLAVAHERITTADQSGELLVPRSALPPGLEPSAIKISRVDTPEASLTTGGDPSAIMYSLEPDGTQFAEPVVARLTVPLTEDMAIPVLYHVSGDQVSPLSASVEIDEAAGQAVISTAITHFSAIVMLNNGLIFLSSSLYPGDQKVGEPFSIPVRIRPRTYQWHGAFSFSGITYDLLEWSIKGEWRVTGGKAEPALVQAAPPLTKVGSPQFTTEQEFTCAVPGLTEITYQGQIRVNVKESYDSVLLRLGGAESEEKQVYVSFDTSSSFECLGLEPTATPTLLPTPTAKPSPSPTPEPTVSPVANITSSFDSDLEGWSGSRGNCFPMEHRSGDGNPGGYLFVDNGEGVACRILAAEKFRLARDLRGFYGGTLSFDGRMFDAIDETWDGRQSQGGGGKEGSNYGTVIIQGHGGVIQADIVVVPAEPAPQLPPWSGWQSHSISLRAGTQSIAGGNVVSWMDVTGTRPATEAEIRAALQAVISIELNIEAIYGREMQGIDNFSITAAPWNPEALIDTLPVVTGFTATRDDDSDQTAYEISVFDDDMPGLRFDWRLSSICGDFSSEQRPRLQPGASGLLPALSGAVWTHGGCNEDLLPQERITIEITDSGGSAVLCIYERGSESTTGPGSRPDGFSCAD
jgi:hypothetical protein